jgi:hypothetical protein
LSITFPKNKGANGKITILDNDFALFDNNLFRKGQRIAFLCGWKHELVPVGPFIVKNYGLDCPNSGEVTLIVDFQDLSHKMNKKQKRKRWVGTPVSILKQIADMHGLGYDLDPISGVEYTEEFPIVQANMTDAALIQRLAWRYGFIWGVYGNNLIFKSPADLESTGAQSPKEVPTLRYRHGDFSLDSFSPEVKFSKGGRRKSKKLLGSNIDLTDPDFIQEQLDEALEGMTTEELQDALGDKVGDFDSESIMDNLEAGFSDLGSLFGLEGDQSADDERTDSTGRNFDGEVSYFLNEYEGILEKYTKRPTITDEENTETDIGNLSGTASAPNSKESRNKQAGKIVRAAEITTGTARPTIASMYYRPRMAVILAGLGKKLSGKYEVTQVSLLLSGEGQIFESDLKVIKRKFGPAPKEKSKIDLDPNKDQSPPVPGTQDTSTGQPGPPRYYLDEMSGDIVRKVRGESKVVSTVEGRTATLVGE